MPMIRNLSLTTYKRRHTQLFLIIAATAISLSACRGKDDLSDEGLNEGAVSASGLPAGELSTRESEAIEYIRKTVDDSIALKKGSLRVEAVMKKSLFDPSSLQLDGVRLGRNGSVCGKYNAKNRMGAYVGYKDFLITKDDELITSDRNDGIASSDGNYFSYQYAEYCATKKELKERPEPVYYDEPNYEADSTPRTQQAPDSILDAPASYEDSSEDEIPTI